MKEALARALALASRATASRTTLPVLQNVLLETRESELIVKATNLGVGLAVAIPARIEEPGAGTVPARVFTDFVAALAGDTVGLEWTAPTATLNVRCGAFRSRIKGVDASEFPTWPARGETETVVTFNDAALLAAAVGQVSVAAAVNEARPVLTGVCAVIESSGVTFAAADGFRLAVKRVAASVQPLPAEALRLTLPLAAIKLLQVACGDDGAVELRKNAATNRVAFLAPGIEIFAGLIDGEYPLFERLIPSATVSRAVFARGELRDALKAGKPFATKTRVDLGADKARGVLVVGSQAAETGDCAGEVGIALDGDAFALALSGAYIGDCLGTLDTPQVALEYTGSSSPAVLRAVGDDAYVCVIMPMTANAEPTPAPPPAPVSEPVASIALPNAQPEPVAG
jgi:DNA polymerase-3 subunit beta